MRGGAKLKVTDEQPRHEHATAMAWIGGRVREGEGAMAWIGGRVRL
jgi:hypothetical protein